MSESIRIYHNPRCSKSRKALQLLQERNYHPEIIKYLEQGLTATDLRGLLDLLGTPASELLRRKEAVFADLLLDEHLDDEGAILDAIAEHPILLERPIVVFEDKACIARPPERLLELLPT